MNKDLNVWRGQEVNILLKTVITTESDVTPLSFSGLFIMFDGQFIYMNTRDDNVNTFTMCVAKDELILIEAVQETDKVETEGSTHTLN